MNYIALLLIVLKVQTGEHWIHWIFSFSQCYVERSFSVFKNLLTDKRTNLTEEHIEMYLMIQFNKNFTC